MACNGCKDKGISDHYKCSRCLVKDSEFKWAVITKAEDKKGNQYDETSFGKSAKDIKSIKIQNFYVGELLMIDPWFGRELTGRGRKPGKWEIEYEVFPARHWKKAAQRAADLKSW